LVTIDTNYEEQLGIRFGVTTKGDLTGTFDASNQLRQGTTAPNVVPPTERLNFNNPAGALSSQAIPATIGVALARLGDVLLDMELSALEEEGHGQVISSPHVITSNQKKAHIETGEEIPYQESTSSGATSVVFKKAVLSLEITPQITADNKVILHLKATEDARGQQLTTPTGGAVLPPVIESHEVESDVLLKNNETIVIGGVYKHTKTNTVDRVPFFGTLPVVGALFRHTAIINHREELLIFITPKIIKSAIANASKSTITYPYPAKKLHYKGEV